MTNEIAMESEPRGEEITGTNREEDGGAGPRAGEVAAFVHLPGENADDAIDLGPVPVDSFPSSTRSAPGKRNRHDVLVGGSAINDADAPMPAIRGERIEPREGPAPDPDDAHKT